MKLLVKVSAIVIGVSLSMVSAAEEALRDSSVSSIEDTDFASNTGSSKTNSNESLPARYSIAGVTAQSLNQPISNKQLFYIEVETIDPKTDIYSLIYDEKTLSITKCQTDCPNRLKELLDFYAEAHRTSGLSVEEKKAVGVSHQSYDMSAQRIRVMTNITFKNTVKASTELMVLKGIKFQFGFPNAFAIRNNSVVLHFLHPESVVSSIMLEWDPVNSHKAIYTMEGNSKAELFFGSVWGQGTCIPGYHTHLNFNGFKKIFIFYNVDALRKLKEEGRLVDWSDSK